MPQIYTILLVAGNRAMMDSKPFEANDYFKHLIIKNGYFLTHNCLIYRLSKPMMSRNSSLDNAMAAKFKIYSSKR